MEANWVLCTQMQLSSNPQEAKLCSPNLIDSISRAESCSSIVLERYFGHFRPLLFTNSPMNTWLQLVQAVLGQYPVLACSQPIEQASYTQSSIMDLHGIDGGGVGNSKRHLSFHSACNYTQPLNMLDQILHIQKITCHSTTKMIDSEGIFQVCFHYWVTAPFVLH